MASCRNRFDHGDSEVSTSSRRGACGRLQDCTAGRVRGKHTSPWPTLDVMVASAPCFRIKEAIFTVYVLLWVLSHLLIYASKLAGAPPFNSTSAVLFTELVKLLLALGLYIRFDGNVRQLTRTIAATTPLLLKYSVPALLYAVYNNLVYINLASFDPGTYNVLMQLRIIMTGVIYQQAFSKRLNRNQWMAIVLIAIGCMAKESSKLTSTEGIQQNRHAWLLLLIQMLSSVCAGVYNEVLLKGEDSSPTADSGILVTTNLQNAYMYLMSVFWNLLVLTYQGRLGEAVSHENLIVLCSPIVLSIIAIMSTVGLVTGFFLKHLDSVLKAVASALEVMSDGSFLVCKPGQTGSTIGRSSGAVLRISADGRKVTSLADGFRQPYLGYDPLTDQVAVTDQQGHFVPSTPLVFLQRGSFYGHPNGDADKDRLVSPPLAWIPHQECGSAAAVVWMRNSRMGGLSDQPVLLSFNPPRLFQVHPDSDEFVSQGGVTPLPLALHDPLLKGAVNPADGLLYLAGFNIWGTKAKGKTFLGRVRPAPKSVLPVPLDVRSGRRGILLRFADALDEEKASQLLSYSVRGWNYKRTPKYGSPNYKPDGSAGTETWPLSSVKLSRDKKTVFLGVPGMREVMQIEVSYDLSSQDGSPIRNKSFLTAHLLRRLSLEKEGFADDRVDLKINGSQPVAQRPPQPTLEKGKALYAQLGCIGCHSVDGTREGRTGPSWLGLFGSKRKLTTGEVVTADEAYLRESILNPSAKVAEGAVNGEAGMPIYEGVLNEEQIQSILLYARSLGR